LEVHELRVKQRSFDKNTEQALKVFQAQAAKKVNSDNWKSKKSKNKWNNHKEKRSSEDNDSKNKGEGTSKKSTNGNKKKFNKKNVQCYIIAKSLDILLMSVDQRKSPRILMMRSNLHMLMI
jgi:Mg-chelatase subunit ChlI